MNTNHMSIRAYRIIKIERAEKSSFNMWHDTPFLEWVEDNGDFVDYRNDDGAGTYEVSVETLQKALDDKTLILEDYIREAIQNDIVFAKVHEDDYVLYDCF